MNKEEIKLTNEHKKNISMRVVVLILIICLASYLFKIFGSDLFNKFITNESFIKASNFIDNNIWLNILVYGILGYIITQCTFCITCYKLKLKWFEYIIIFAFSIGMSALRYYYVGAITYLFDLIQYILIPIMYGCFIRRTNIIKNMMYCLLIYFANCGLITYNMSLCGLKSILYTSNFIAYVLSFIEIYLLLISFTIFITNGGFENNVKSNVSFKQKERPKD